MPVDRNKRLVCIEQGQALDISLGEIIDGLKEDILADPAMMKKLAEVLAPHLAATVRPT